MKRWIIICVLLPIILCSQKLPKECSKWLDENLSDKNVDSSELLSRFIKWDFSSVWLSHQDAMLGFIGDNYQRFYIFFTDIVKSDTLPSCYLARGKTRVMNNVCDFEGEIKILHIREIDKQKREEILKDCINEPYLIKIGQYEKFVIFAEYLLNENQNQKGSGQFIGALKSYFYVKSDSVFYYDLDFYSDSFSNNLFVGIWKSYNTGVEKKCNWGNYRIPCSGDLDIGASEFSPNDKYLNYGWLNYRKAYFENDIKAKLEEKKQWWKEK